MLAGVCVTLRWIFRPLVKFTITIVLGGSSNYALWKALAITRASTFLDSVGKLNIGQMTSRWSSRWIGQFPIIFSPTLFTLTKAVPAMRQLHTVQLSQIFLPRTFLYCILSSPHLTYLILEAIHLPVIYTFPPPPWPPKLRKLTLREMHSWDALEPLIALVATSLEYLEFHCCDFKFPDLYQQQFHLPSFSCLHELRHYQRDCFQFDNAFMLIELLQLAPRVTHLHVFGQLYYPGIPSPPKSLQHLSTDEWMLPRTTFGVDPWSQLTSLTLRGHIFTRPRCDLDLALYIYHHFVRHHFPGITFLHLHIPWSFRNFALVLARSQQNVLDLFIVIPYSVDWEEKREKAEVEVEISANYLCNAILPAPLRSLRLDIFDNTGQGIGPWTRWVNNNILPVETGLGGLDLRSIELSFIQPESRSERERVLRRRRWDKSPNDDWKIGE